MKQVQFSLTVPTGTVANGDAVPFTFDDGVSGTATLLEWGMLGLKLRVPFTFDFSNAFYVVVLNRSVDQFNYAVVTAKREGDCEILIGNPNEGERIDAVAIGN